MGYTHYWNKHTFSHEVWAKIKADIQQLIEASTIPLAREYDDAASKPEILDNYIRFNGVGDDGHETFVLEQEIGGFEFCKTARKQYDELAVACLIIAHHHDNAFTWSSDGTPEEQVNGFTVAKQVNPDIEHLGLTIN